MAALDHTALVKDFETEFSEAQSVLEDIVNHLTKTKGQSIRDLLGQMTELLQRIQTASTTQKLEVEVARAIARDFETIGTRWRELERFFTDKVQYDDYIYKTDEERARYASQALEIIQNQALIALDAAGAMFGAAQEWRRAAKCFNIVVQARRVEKSRLAPLAPMIREYRCYEQLNDLPRVLHLGRAIHQVLGSSIEAVSEQEQAMLQEAAEYFRKTAMKAITNRQANPDLNIPLGAVYLWCEAEALDLIVGAEDDTSLLRFRALAEFYEQIGKEELAKPSPSFQRFVTSYFEGTFAYLRIDRDIHGLTKLEAQQKSLELTRYIADFVISLIERLGYQQVRIVDDSSKAMRGLNAILSLIHRGFEGSLVFNQLSKKVGNILAQGRQTQDQILIDLTTVFRWLFEGAGITLELISIKLVSDIYRVALIKDTLDVGSQMELRQKIRALPVISEYDDIFGLFIDAEIEFDDAVDLFNGLGLFWIAAICKQNQGQLRQNIGILEVSGTPELSTEQANNFQEEKEELDEVPFWGAAPSLDFTLAAELFTKAFRHRLEEDGINSGTNKTWIPYRNPEELRRRAAHSYRLAGLAHIEEGNIEQGGRELIHAKNAYELLNRHAEAIACLNIWAHQIVASISGEDSGGARPTQARLQELLKVCDELVGLYAIRRTSTKTITDILGIIKFLLEKVRLENWILPVYLRAIEYTQEALRIATVLDKIEEPLRMLRFLREELGYELESDFVIGIYPTFENELNVYFETETPIKLAVLNISDHEIADLTVRPLHVLPHLSPSPSHPWKASRDPSQISMKYFYVGCDDNAYELTEAPDRSKPPDAFGPPRALPIEFSEAPPALIETEETTELTEEERPWLGIMWSGDFYGMPIGTLKGATEEPTDEEGTVPSVDDLITPAFFTVFTKIAREGNIIPGQIFPVTFGVFKGRSTEPIAIQTIHFKIVSRPKLLQVETHWSTDLKKRWEDSFSILYEEGAHLPRYVPRFAPEFEPNAYVEPKTLTPTITMGQNAVELTKYLKDLPHRFNLRYFGECERLSGQNFLVKNSISLEIPMYGPVVGEYEFLRIELPPRILTEEELKIPRLRNGVNFQEVFYGTVFIGDSKFDGEYYIYRIWICFEPGEKSPAPGANYRQGWTNHRLDIFLDPKTWEPRLLVTDYYVKLENGQGEWIEALYTFKAASSTFFGIRRLYANFHRDVFLENFDNQLNTETRRLLQHLGVNEKTPLNTTGFKLGQRLGFIDLIRVSWARDKRDGPVLYKPLRAHLFRDYWSQRYEHGLYREDWRGNHQINEYEMRTNDRSGGRSKYVRGFGTRQFPHEIRIIPRQKESCDLVVSPPGEPSTPIVIRNVVNPRAIELWTRPHISFSRRFNWFAKRFGKPPDIHTASLYFYSTRRELNPYFKATIRGKDHWVHFPESNYWTGKRWVPIPEKMRQTLHPENLSYGINSWLEADAYWVYRYVWYWPLEITFPLPHEDWERADIWVNARTGNIEWITSDYHWRELWYENAAKLRGVNPIIDFLYNWNTPEPLTVKDGAQVHQSITPYFTESKRIGEFADQLPWMFTRYRESAEHLHKLHQGFWGRNKVKIVYGLLFFLIFLLVFFLTPLGSFLTSLFLP